MCPLNYRQRLFIEAYLGEASQSAVAAARRAGYRRPDEVGPKLAARSQIRAAIDAGETVAGLRASEVLARAADVASADLLGFSCLDELGVARADLKLLHRRGLGHVIKRLKTGRDGAQDIELEPKSPALFKFGEHLRLWKGEARQELTLVQLAKDLKERNERIRAQRENPGAAGSVPG